MQVVTASALCFCGSGKTIDRCCNAVVLTSPPGPLTGYAHPKCYARALADCSAEITREHYVSNAVLKLLPLKEMQIHNAPFLAPGQVIGASQASMPSKVLCGRHNAALSPLDVVGQRFFEVALAKTDQTYSVMRGIELERWMLKFMCGFLASGQALTRDGRRVPKSEPPARLLRVLFGTDALNDGCGLYLANKSGREIATGQMTYAVFEHNGSTGGCVFVIDHVELFFALTPMPESLGEGVTVVYRPASIMIEKDSTYREVHLGWVGGKNFHLRLEPKRPDQ